MEFTEQDIRDLQELKEKITDNFSLCEFMGMAEKELLVAQTIHAAVNNYNSYGIPCSIRKDSVFSNLGGGLFNNGKAYNYLVDSGYFVEEARPEAVKSAVVGEIVIFPTRKLIDELQGFFTKQES